MFDKTISFLYKVSKKTGKTATMMHDANVLMSLDGEKITKRIIRKGVTKTGSKTIREINKKIK